MRNGANDPKECPDREVDVWDCEARGHEWQLMTRHADPPEHRGILPNAICAHCSEQTWIDLEATADAT
jgi:hypothetical protein